MDLEAPEPELRVRVHRQQCQRETRLRPQVPEEPQVADALTALRGVLLRRKSPGDVDGAREL
eukprot:CAMPEP_0175768652 /NCGR_PEP_ID=MMETSP0097-20121207/70543_1 /TAXON_ID=311494 /ORGANISM="Alexandrium monilatum, Strain CCMP3105" /LENGTH=61 /DNA_ID=CAMNT_0017078779 /DNA_START=1 /DNA_END=182 /DNA_ORIENTATION=+